MGDFAVFGQDIFGCTARCSYALANESNGRVSIFRFGLLVT